MKRCSLLFAMPAPLRVLTAEDYAFIQMLAAEFHAKHVSKGEDAADPISEFSEDDVEHVVDV